MIIVLFGSEKNFFWSFTYLQAGGLTGWKSCRARLESWRPSTLYTAVIFLVVFLLCNFVLFLSSLVINNTISFRLKAESIKKQCIILELEKSVDNFNETLKNFDKTAEELACENACLKNDKDSRIKDLETMQSKLAEKTKELDRTREQLENLEKLNKTGNIAKKSLEAENKLLKNQCESLFKTIKKLELDNETLKKEVEKFQAERGQVEKTLLKNYELQMEVRVQLL